MENNHLPRSRVRGRTPALAWVGAALAGAAATAPAPLFAQVTVDRCVDANTRAQSLQSAGKLGAARDELKVCASAECPTLVRQDCTAILSEVDRAQPTIVFDARDQSGRDLVSVRVSMDGQPFTERLDGMALPADPGEHTFRFEAPGALPVERRFVLKEGEKGRREPILLASEAAPQEQRTTPPPAPAPAGASPQPLGPQRVGALVFGAAGLAALGTGAAFAIGAKIKADDANAICPGQRCPSAQALSMNHDALVASNVATAAVIAGIAGLGAGAALWWTSKSSARAGVAGVQLAWGSVAVTGAW